MIITQMIDERDVLIIDTFRENARTPHTEIAAIVGVGESTIRNRVRALEEEGVIKQYTVVTDPAKLGYNSVSLVGIDAEPSYLLDIALRLSKFPEVKFVATSAGDHTIMTEVWLADGGSSGHSSLRRSGSWTVCRGCLRLSLWITGRCAAGVCCP